MLDAFTTWLAATSLSQFVANSSWVWPAGEVLHFIGLSVLLGVAGLFDLRLMGFFRSVSVDVVHRLMPWAMGAFAVNLATGALFIIGTPGQYAHNPAFYLKMASLGLAGLNAVIFESGVGKRALAVPADGEVPGAARAIGAVSLLSWLSVLYWGRMLAFIGDGGAF
jgi:hypothetical protein